MLPHWRLFKTQATPSWHLWHNVGGRSLLPKHSVALRYWELQSWPWQCRSLAAARWWRQSMWQYRTEVAAVPSISNSAWWIERHPLAKEPRGYRSHLTHLVSEPAGFTRLPGEALCRGLSSCQHARRTTRCKVSYPQAVWLGGSLSHVLIQVPSFLLTCSSMSGGTAYSK